MTMKPLLRSSSKSFAPWMMRAPLAAVLLATANAWAQPTPNEQTAADVTMARQLGNKGLELAEAGNCAEAVDPLARSEAMHHAPTTLAILGECHITLGKLVEGAEELTRVVRENLDSQAPASFHTAQDRARVRLEEARPRIPKLRLAVRGAGPSAALTVRLDGEAIPVASLELDRPVNPGLHRVEAGASGFNRATFGVGAAGIAVGSVLGVVTLSKTSSLEKSCPTRSTCPASAQSDIDTSKTTALTSTISFGVGAAGLLAGLYFTLRAHGFSGPAVTASERARRPTLRPWIGLGSGGFDGSF
jgi:hypothetical protein